MKNSIFTFKITLSEDNFRIVDKNAFRVIEIKGDDPLYDFAEAITEAFDFGFDHPFGFYSNIKNNYKSDEKYELFADLDDCDVDPGVKGVEGISICEVFKPRKKMLFLFDYGDDWYFIVECTKISEPEPKVKYPRVIEKVGRAPEQYPEYDEEEDDDE